MSRRRLRVVCSSDDEEEVQQLPTPHPPPPLQQQHEQDVDAVIVDGIEIDFQTVTLKSSNPIPISNNSSNTTNTFGNGRQQPEPVHIDISDESDENIVNSEPVNNSNFENTNRGYFERWDSVNGVLEGLGLRLRREWLDSCLCGLQSQIPGFQGMEDAAKAKFCFEQFLHSDMNYCGAGVLPPNVQSLHFADLKGPFILQVDEIVNISCPLRGRYQNATAGVKRCLKLSMTDGVQRVFGMEYRPIKDLEVLAPAGLKVALFNVNVRRGLLILVPEVLQVLGGAVEELETARQRVVNEINKPPRGQRTRTGVVPSQATRATLAAWPQLSGAPQHGAQTTVMNTSHQPIEQGTTISISADNVHEQAYATVRRNNAEFNLPATLPASQLAGHGEVARHTDIHLSRSLNDAGEGALFGSSDMSSREDLGVPVSRMTVEPSISSAVQPLDPISIPRHIDELMAEAVDSTESGQVHTPSIPANDLTGEDAAVIVSPDNAEQNISRAIDMDVVEISMFDDLEQHFMHSRDNEIPFTYLTSLSAKCAANEDGTLSVRGKIKCFLTGVKGFQFRQRTAYELRAFVDDGSLISEILIDHKVVQNIIGYSPQEVTTALESTDTEQANKMKETMRQFQKFLANFEGIMLVECSKASPVPVAVDMNLGCSTSDAWLLLQRLKSLSYVAKQKPSHLNPIEPLHKSGGCSFASCKAGRLLPRTSSPFCAFFSSSLKV